MGSQRQLADYAYGDCYDKWNVMMCGMFLEAFSSEQLAQEASSDVKILHVPIVCSASPCIISGMHFPSFCGSESDPRLTTLAAPAPRLGGASWVNRETGTRGTALRPLRRRSALRTRVTTVRLVRKSGSYTQQGSTSKALCAMDAAPKRRCVSRATCLVKSVTWWRSLSS